MPSSRGFAAGSLFVSFLAVATASAFAAEPVVVEPVVVERWDFNRAGDVEGWTIGANVAEMAVADGLLRIVGATSDAYIIGPAIDAPLDGCVVRVALRCKLTSHLQVFYATDDQPTFAESRSASDNMFVCAPAAEAPAAEANDTPPSCPFTVHELAIGKSGDANRRLIRLRIDACNGCANVAEIDWVELVRTPPQVEVTAAFDHHHVQTDEPANLTARVRQVAGWRAAAGYRVSFADDAVNVGPPSERPASTSRAFEFERPGVRSQRVKVTGGEADASFDLESSIVVGAGESLPIMPALKGEFNRLDLGLTPDAQRVGAARWCIRDASGEWRLAGWLLPLTRLIVRQVDGTIVQREPALSPHSTSPQWVRLEGAAKDQPDWRVQVDFRIEPRAGTEIITAEATLIGPAGGELLAFDAPVLRIDREGAPGPLDRFGLFGGLEMLEPGWRSSSERAIGEKHAARWTPHPFKVSVPMMTIEASGLTTSMLWQPLDKWDGEHAMPAATFASPNFLDGQSNHLMKLHVPSIPEWSDENRAYASRPYVMDANRPLTLRYVLQGEPGEPAMVATRRWFELFGAPVPPPEVHGDRAFYDLVARCYGETMYWPDEKGWTHHWWFPAEPGYLPQMAGFLVAHAADTGQTTWVNKTNLQDRAIIDAAGTLASRLHGVQHARHLAASMRPDGTWPFKNTPKMREQAREFTQGNYDNLGEDGATTLGTCASQAVVILRAAELTGDADLAAAALKALGAMRQFRVPRGAQVWEVHLEIPDIRAAALAVQAYHIAYRLTQDRRHLDEAGYWAWTGATFVYAWHVPIEHMPGVFLGTRERTDFAFDLIPLSEPYASGMPQVTPYATLPVLGPTFYVHSWFGVPVQWCGLEWAQHVIELDADRPDPLLRYIADGVVLSGLQQMMDREPWVGLYPDSWLLAENRAQPAMICPDLILKCRQAQGRLPALETPWTRILRDRPTHRRWHVSGWGKPVELDPPSATDFSATLAFPAGQPNELLLAGVDRPRTVRAGGVPLAEYGIAGSASKSAGEPGWRYDLPQRCLMMRFEQNEANTRVEIGW